MLEAQQKITALVNSYIEKNEAEFIDFKIFMSAKRGGLKDTAHAEMPNSDVIERKIYEIPEKLYYLFREKLIPIHKDYLKSRAGAIWFAKKFKVFRASEKV